MRNWPYAGKTFISREGLPQEHRLCELGCEVVICYLNDQEEKEIETRLYIHCVRDEQRPIFRIVNVYI